MRGGSDTPGKILYCDDAQTVELASWWKWLMPHACHCSRG